MATVGAVILVAIVHLVRGDRFAAHY
jgi:uncharacterized membrane protein YeaQ/YmgE (transglycosylase-associated protein family)